MRFSGFPERLSTSVNGVEKRDTNPVRGKIRRLQSPSSLTSAPTASGPLTSEISRHPRSTDSC